jgi:hypothetical protein
MEQYNINKKYPKSTSGKQCVGPCYKKNTKIIHPMYLSIITDTHNDAFCPVAEWTKTDKDSGKIQRFHVDKCNEYTHKENTSEYATSYDLLYPYVDFNEEIFLQLFYNINNFSEAIQWIEDNKHTPIDSRQRIFDLSIDAFGHSFDIIETSDTRIVDFLLNIIKTKFLNKVVIQLFRFVNINSDIVELKANDKKENDDSIIIKTNYIVKNLLTIENVTNFISNYFRTQYKESRMQYHTEIIIDKFTIYIIGNIKKTFIK